MNKSTSESERAAAERARDEAELGGHDPQAPACEEPEDRPQPDRGTGPGELLAKKIRAKLGPYNDEERAVEELVGVLVNHVHQANQYRAMVIQGGQAAQAALNSGEAQRAVDLLLAVTRPPAQPQQPQQPEGSGDAE